MGLLTPASPLTTARLIPSLFKPSLLASGVSGGSSEPHLFTMRHLDLSDLVLAALQRNSPFCIHSQPLPSLTPTSSPAPSKALPLQGSLCSPRKSPVRTRSTQQRTLFFLLSMPAFSEEARESPEGLADAPAVRPTYQHHCVCVCVCPSKRMMQGRCTCC